MGRSPVISSRGKHGRANSNSRIHGGKLFGRCKIMSLMKHDSSGRFGTSGHDWEITNKNRNG